MILLLLGCRSGLVSESEPAGAGPWDRFLAENVRNGRVDWAALEQDREPLDGFVAGLAEPGAFAGRIKADRHALWLNALTALSLFQVLETDADRLDARGWLPFAGSAFFVETAFLVGGEWVSLSEIVNERLRMKELDFRDHAAMHFGNAGSPPLRAGLYRQADLSAQLDEAMERWVAGDGVVIEADRVLFAGRFDHYAKDFLVPGRDDSLCALVARHGSAEKRAALEAFDLEGCPHGFQAEDMRVLRE